MEQDFYSRMSERAAVNKTGRTRFLLGAVLASFLLGAAVTSLVAWKGLLPGSGSSASPGTSPIESAPGVPAPSPSEQVAAKNAQKAVEKVAQQQGGLEARVVAMEQRLTQLDLQAQAASGNTARAEGLLIAFAARRAIERGAPLGYLGEQLRLRFGNAQPNAVKDVLAEADKPVPLDQLKAQLNTLAPRLVDENEEGLSWTWFKREVSELFIFRSDETPSPAPESRLERAKLRLEAGQVETAIAEVRLLPGAAAAQQWIDDAERYGAAEHALDLLETTALLEPRELRDAKGRQVQQPSPAGKNH